MDKELHCAMEKIMAFLPGKEPLRFPEVVDALRGEGVGEEAVRVGLWALIDERRIDLTYDWRVSAKTDEVAP